MLWSVCRQPFLGILKDVLWYMAPLALLDTVIVKKYNGVDPTLWRTKELAWIQTTRALPASPPSVGQLFFQVLYNKEVQGSRTVCLI